MSKLNLLIAYPYVTPGVVRLVSQNQHKIRFVLDSGAFTAWKAGKTIALDDYCRFVESLPFKPWRYFALDVVGDPHGTMKNYEIMLKRGFNPIPVFTRGEDPNVLEDYYKTSEVVGIGGLVGTVGNKGFVRGIMDRVKARRCHWLGFANINFVKYYKPYMCDSSYWESGARFASIPLYMGGGRIQGIGKHTVKNGVPSDVRTAVQRLGLNPDELMIPERWNGGQSISRRLGAASMVKLSMELEQRLGTHYFLATATEYASVLLIEAAERFWRQAK